MKIQIEGQHLRIRIDEDELAQLLDGETLLARTHFADAFAIDVALQLTDAVDAGLGGDATAWVVALPEAAIREHSSRLPTREGLSFLLGGKAAGSALTLLFDVDVRDSVRRRKLR